jgi:maleate isomerase
MYMEDTTPEAEGEMLDTYAMPAARDVGSARPHVIVFGCTSAGALRGNDFDAALCERIREETGAAVVSVISSVRLAIRRRSARRVGIVTPYVDSLNEKIRASVEADGVEVAAIHGLGITENFEIANVTPRNIAEFAADRLAGLPIDLVFVSCTNFRAMEAIPDIERQVGIPVVTSNQAALESTVEAVESIQGVSLPAAQGTIAGSRW